MIHDVKKGKLHKAYLLAD